MQFRKLRPILVSMIVTLLLANFSALSVLARQDGKVVKVATANVVSPLTVSLDYGLRTFGSDFGLNEPEDAVTAMDSGPIAIQAILSGQYDVLSGSFLLLYSLREQGQIFKMFCPLIGKNDQIIVARNGITSLDQVFGEKVRVGIDGPGGGVYALFNAVMLNSGSKLTSADLKNAKILESSGQRVAAFTAGDIDVTIMRVNQYRQIQDQVPDSVILAKAYENLPMFIFSPLSAPSEWLDKNRETAAAFCAAVLKGTIDLIKSPESYIAGVKSFVSKPPSDEALKETYDIIVKYGVWNPALTMNPEAVDFMTKLAKTMSLAKDEPTATEMMDMDTFEAAVALLSKEDQAALAAMSSANADSTEEASTEATPAN